MTFSRAGAGKKRKVRTPDSDLNRSRKLNQGAAGSGGELVQTPVASCSPPAPLALPVTKRPLALAADLRLGAPWPSAARTAALSEPGPWPAWPCQRAAALRHCALGLPHRQQRPGWPGHWHAPPAMAAPVQARARAGPGLGPRARPCILPLKAIEGAGSGASDVGG